MFTSCCPAWIKYLENENPKYLKNISTCKSPMEMFGALMKDRAKKMDAEDGRTTYHIAIMPCTAKKMKAKREEFIHDGVPDVDLLLTTREIIDMIKEAGIRFNDLEGEPPICLTVSAPVPQLFSVPPAVLPRLLHAVWLRKSPRTHCRCCSFPVCVSRTASVLSACL